MSLVFRENAKNRQNHGAFSWCCRPNSSICRGGGRTSGTTNFANDASCVIYQQFINWPQQFKYDLIRSNIGISMNLIDQMVPQDCIINTKCI